MDQEKQILIIRQNCIGNAVNLIKQTNPPENAPLTQSVLAIAGEFEKWVLRDVIKDDAGVNVKNDEEIPF